MPCREQILVNGFAYLGRILTARESYIKIGLIAGLGKAVYHPPRAASL